MSNEFRDVPSRSVTQCLLLPALLLVLLSAPARAQAPDVVASRLEEVLSELRERSSFPGATIGYVTADGTVGSVSAGLAFRETETPMRPDHRMMAGSTGKTFFAALALQLVEQDVLGLDEPISTWLADEPWLDRLPNGRTITLRMLLQHTSGIPRYVMSPDFVEAMVADRGRRWEPVELLAFVLDADPLFAAGDGWAYADTNFIVAGIIIEKVTGASCYSQIHERILRPHELRDIVPTTSRDVLGLAGGYVDPRGNLLRLERDNVVQGGRFVFDPQFEWAGGGFAATPRDLARWARLLYAGDVLSERMRREMRGGVPARLGPGSRYGLGLMMRPSPHGEVIGHAGYFPGYLTDMAYYVEHDLALAIQVNTTRLSEALNPAVLQTVLDACAGELIASGSER